MPLRLSTCIAAALLAALAACKDAPSPDTKVMGGHGPSPSAAAGQVPPPPAPAGARAQVVPAANGQSIAVWVQDGHVRSATYAPATGWTAAQVLEDIFGESSDLQLAGDGSGTAMAVWRHTVGSIQSLRFSRFDAAGWSVPDVMPGALPRAAGSQLQLEMDAQGHATARWPSGFEAQEAQVARYVPGQGWSKAVSEPVAAAPAPQPVRP